MASELISNKAKDIYEFTALDIDGQFFQFVTRVAAFPCNQFGNQEPGTEAEIKQGVTEKYGVEFDMFSKEDLTIIATLVALLSA